MINVDSDGPVTTLTLDAPEVKHAFDEGTIRALTAGIQAGGFTLAVNTPLLAKLVPPRIALDRAMRRFAEKKGRG